MNARQQAEFSKLEAIREKYESMVSTCPDYWQFCARQTAKLAIMMVDVRTNRKPLNEAARLAVDNG